MPQIQNIKSYLHSIAKRKVKRGEMKDERDKKKKSHEFVVVGLLSREWSDLISLPLSLSLCLCLSLCLSLSLSMPFSLSLSHLT